LPDSSDSEYSGDAGARDGALSPAACSGPPAMLSLGAYPMGSDQWVTSTGFPYGAAIRGTVQAISIQPTGCTAPPSVAEVLGVDEVLWSYRSAGLLGMTIEVGHAPGFAVGQQLLVFGDDIACIGAIEAIQFLDLARYPNAVADMTKLRAFVADRTDYDKLIAADGAVDVTVTAAVRRPPNCFNNPYATSYDLTLQIHQTLCGAMTSPVTAHYDPALLGAAPPTVGARSIYFLGPYTNCDGLPPRDDYDVVDVFTPDQWSRLSSLHASPPALSL
jgi:hypothetical protein